MSIFDQRIAASSACASSSHTNWLLIPIGDGSARWPIAAITAAALAIRLYLVFTAGCIAPDGVAYLAMAREFAAGEPARALAWVFSPLYPWMIAVLHRLTPDWELTAEMISVVLGTATIPLIYYLMRESFGRRDIALCAAVLAAIHPDLAAYSASARTEAGYIFFVTAVLCLTAAAVKRRSMIGAAAAGIVCGLAYLYRTEAVGVPVVVAGLLVVEPMLGHAWSQRFGIMAAAAFSFAFLIVASPYLIYLRAYTGHWTVGRELGVVVMESTGASVGDIESWRRLGYTTSTSGFTAIAISPRAYARKVVLSFGQSCYNFIQALDPLLAAMMVVGLWLRRRGFLMRWHETMLARVVAFYFIGFAFTATGARLLLHVVPFTLGWVAIGIEAVARSFAGWRATRRIPAFAPILLIALVLMPRTLWPLESDTRALRKAGLAIAARHTPNATVAARDPRVAFYANANFVRLPTVAGTNICDWLARNGAPNYLMIESREEARWGGVANTQCLGLIKRYRRRGKLHYDLFNVGLAPLTGFPAYH